jgi:ATP-binding cassette subfamily F protein 3
MDGEMHAYSRMKVGNFAQQTLEGLELEETPYQHERERMPSQLGESQVRGRVARIGFSGARADVPVKSLSGGEKARLAMGLAVFDAPHLLILDEPTNHLDIDSRAALVDALTEYEGAVILVSHDRHLLDACADELWLVQHGTVKPFDGTLDDYTRIVLKAARSNAEGKPAEPTEEVSRTKRASPSALKHKLKQVEEVVAKLEPEIARLDKQLADPDLYARDSEKAAALAKQRMSLAAALAEAEELWLDTSERLAGAETTN